MNPEQLLQHFDRISEAPDAIPRLRRFILDLAVRGKLVEQDQNDERADILLNEIHEKKSRLIQKHSIKKQHVLKPIDLKDAPFKIPESWSWVLLGDLTDLVYGKLLPTTDLLPEGYEVFGANGVIGKYSKFIYEDEMLLISCRGAYSGTPNISPRRCYVTNNSIVCQFFYPEKCDIRFFHTVLSVSSRENIVTGAAQPQVTVANAVRLHIPLPPLAEQHRIVAKVDELMVLCDQFQAAQTEREQSRDRLVVTSLQRLNQLDESRRPGRDCRDPDFRDENDIDSLPAVSNQKQANVSIMEAKPAYLPVNWVPAIPAGTTGFDDVRFVLANLPRLTTRPAHIKQLRQTILSLAVRGKLVPQNPNDEPAAELLKRVGEERAKLVKAGEIRNEKPLIGITNDDLPFSIPDTWKWAKIGSSALFTEYGTSQQSFQMDDGVPVLKMGDIQDGKVLLGGQKKVSNAIDDLPALYLKKFDLLYNRTNSAELVGKTGIYLGDDNQYTFASYLIRIRLSKFAMNAMYFNLAMNSPYFRTTQIVPHLKQQCGQANVNGTILKNMLVPIPPLAEQHRIVAKVDELMALCDQLETQLTSTAADSRRLLEAVLHEALLPATEQAA